MNTTATRNITLQTPHLQQAMAFYRDTLGMRVFLSTPEMVGLHAGHVDLFLELAPSCGPLLEFIVDDLSAARRRLLNDGCMILENDPEIPRLFVRDPFGLQFSLVASAADSAEPDDIRPAERPPHY